MLASIASYAQELIHLQVDNIAPRVGDVVKVSIPIHPEIDHSFLTDESEETLKDSSAFKLGSITISMECEKQGDFQIGPYEFDFNGKQIKTDSVILFVEEKLPFIEKAFIRVINTENESFIIVEQLLREKKSSTTLPDGLPPEFAASFSSSEQRKNDEFVEMSARPTTGISLMRTYSTKSSKDSPSGRSYTYFFQKYTITKSASFKGPYTLKKDDFIRLPRTSSIENLNIK